MNAIIKLLLSLRTIFTLLLLTLLTAALGSVMLPRHLAFFSGIDDAALFKWLSDSGQIDKTWWIYSFVLLFALMGASTAACTIDALIRIKDRRGYALITGLSPQVLHMGVMFVMLGHLLTAWHGIREDIKIDKAQTVSIGQTISMELVDVRAITDSAGNDLDWEAKLIIGGAGIDKDAVLRPARPVFVEGMGLFIKSIDTGKSPSALIRVTRDPGAVWSLIGGVLICIGGMGFIHTKFRE